jgi:P27 family predicted phage terminase small subunit
MPSKTRTSDIPQTPPNLSPDAQELWRQVTREWELETSSLAVLRVACESMTEMQECQKVIKKEGRVTKDRWGQLKPNPCVAQLRDARTSFLRAVKQLGLDLEPLNPHPGRPSAWNRMGEPDAD